jgi:hypothetical protein
MKPATQTTPPSARCHARISAVLRSRAELAFHGTPVDLAAQKESSGSEVSLPDDSGVWLLKRNRFRYESTREPGVLFRIPHAAPDGHNPFPGAEFHDQTFQIGLEHMGAFENGNVSPRRGGSLQQIAS